MRLSREGQEVLSVQREHRDMASELRVIAPSAPSSPWAACPLRADAPPPRLPLHSGPIPLGPHGHSRAICLIVWTFYPINSTKTRRLLECGNGTEAQLRVQGHWCPAPRKGLGVWRPRLPPPPTGRLGPSDSVPGQEPQRPHPRGRSGGTCLRHGVTVKTGTAPHVTGPFTALSRLKL